MPDKLTDAQITSDMAALMATTDGSIPQRLKQLIGQLSDASSTDAQWEITAIEAGKQSKYVPSGPLAPGYERYQWSMDRVSGKTVTPPAILQVEEGYYARVMGNAVALESWLRAEGYHAAFAGSPNAVWIGSRCPGKMRLKSAGYRECEHCGYITED